MKIIYNCEIKVYLPRPPISFEESLVLKLTKAYKHFICLKSPQNI